MTNKTQSEIKKNWHTPASTPLVSIQCAAYNHEPYIEQSLEGFVMQETSFPFEVIVHDDASTDGTADIIRKYESRFPDIIKPIYETENQFSKGTVEQIMDKACRGKYIALCEGDDWWTDKSKLQKQIEFLETHPNISACCCRYNNYNECTKETVLQQNRYFDNPLHHGEPFFIFNLEYNYLKNWTTKTLTMVYRKCINDKVMAILNQKKFKWRRDVHYVFYTLMYGNCACLNFVGGTYRHTQTSIWGSLSSAKQSETNYKVLKEFHNKEKHPVIQRFYKRAKNNYIYNYSYIAKKCRLILRIQHKMMAIFYRIFHIRETEFNIIPKEEDLHTLTPLLIAIIKS